MSYISVEELSQMPGLQYILTPRPDLAWTHGAEPRAALLIEEWPGFIDDRRRFFRRFSIDEDGLIAAGWRAEEMRYWTRYHPPGGPRPPWQVWASRPDQSDPRIHPQNPPTKPNPLYKKPMPAL